jgi:hypothetical protein
MKFKQCALIHGRPVGAKMPMPRIKKDLLTVGILTAVVCCVGISEFMFRSGTATGLILLGQVNSRLPALRRLNVLKLDRACRTDLLSYSLMLSCSAWPALWLLGAQWPRLYSEPWQSSPRSGPSPLCSVRKPEAAKAERPGSRLGPIIGQLPL